MHSPISRLPKISVYYWDLLIVGFSVAILFLTLYCLMEGVTTVFMHLYYFPIIFLAYRYHNRGVVYSLWLSLAYLAMVVYFDRGNSIETIGAALRVLSFMGVAIVVSYLATNLEKRQMQYRSLNEFNQGIVENANVWLSVLDETGKILVWNRAAEEISGYSAGDVIGKRDIWKKLYPETDYRKKITATISSIIAENRFFENFVTVITTRKQERKTISWNTRAVPDEQDRFNHFVAIGIDITKRKQAEDELRAAYEQLTTQKERLNQQIVEIKKSQNDLHESEAEYQNILRTAMDGFCIVDPTGIIIDCNDAFCTMIGYTRNEALTLTLSHIVAKEYAEDITRHLEEIKQKGGDRFESRYRQKSGNIIDVEVSVKYSETHGGHFIAFLHNITERKRAERAFQQATKRLNLLNFITFRDIKDAIFVISGYLELEKEGLDQQQLQKYLDIQMALVHDIERWITVAKNFQDLGLNPPAWQSVNQTFLFAISHLNFMHMSRSITVDQLEIYADPALESVFVNLADNVLKHGKTATAVTLRYQITADSLTLIFEDNGQGIPTDAKEIIFERRYEKKRGMGLFLAREILSITAITIKENGTPGKGARFEITVPKDGYRFARTAATSIM